MNQSYKGDCRALHVHSHTWPRLCKSYLMKIYEAKNQAVAQNDMLRNWYFCTELDFEKQEVWQNRGGTFDLI